MKRTFLAVIFAAVTFAASAKTDFEPMGTYLYAQRDTCELYLDLYTTDPANPTILYVHGGGFMGGDKASKHQVEWFKSLTEHGYNVASISYRQGLKGFKNAGVNFRFINALRGAIGLAVEDLFSATVFLVENAKELGIDPENIIVSGGSAGAMTSLQAEWEICNNTETAKVLPEGFNYAGVISFSGAIFTDKGGCKFAKEPCPIYMAHGTADKIVPYKKIALFNLWFGGSDAISSSMNKQGFTHRIYRYEGNGHEIATSESHLLDSELEFIEQNVVKGMKKGMDSLISDPSIPIPAWARKDYKVLY